MESTQQTPTSSKRPIIITLLSIGGIIYSLFASIAIIVPAGRDVMIEQFGVMFVAIAAITILAAIIGFAGLWKMKKWGFYTYTLAIVISYGAGFYYKLPGTSELTNYIGPLVVIIIGLLYLKKMS